MSEDLTKKLLPTDSEKLTLIIDRLDRVEQTLAERLYDTRPIWQKAMTDIAQLQGRVEGGQEAILNSVGEIKKSLRDIYYRFDVLNNTMLGIRADHQDIDERVRTLENHSNPPNTQT